MERTAPRKFEQSKLKAHRTRIERHLPSRGLLRNRGSEIDCITLVRNRRSGSEAECIVEAMRIIGLCILAAVLYGIVHDQVTARVCVEYFTIGHPTILATESPTMLGLAWGIIATWWVGLILGALLAFASTRGRSPRRTARSLVRPMCILLMCMAGAALISGLVGYVLARNGIVVLVGPLASQVPSDRHVAFIADGWAHSASYLAGFVGGMVLIRRVWKLRQAVTRSVSGTD